MFFSDVFFFSLGQRREKEKEKKEGILAACSQGNVYFRLDSVLRIVLVLIVNSLVMEKFHITVKE